MNYLYNISRYVLGFCIYPRKLYHCNIHMNLVFGKTKLQLYGEIIYFTIRRIIDFLLLLYIYTLPRLLCSLCITKYKNIFAKGHIPNWSEQFS